MNGPVPGAGMVTWQVTDTGVAFLRSHGLAEGASVPLHLMTLLKNTGAIYTGGGGVAGTLAPEVIAGFESRACLALRMSAEDWRVGALISELPNEFFVGPRGV